MAKKSGWWSYPSPTGGWQYNKPPRKGCGKPAKTAAIIVFALLSTAVAAAVYGTVQLFT